MTTRRHNPGIGHPRLPDHHRLDAVSTSLAPLVDPLTIQTDVLFTRHDGHDGTALDEATLRSGRWVHAN